MKHLSKVWAWSPPSLLTFILPVWDLLRGSGAPRNPPDFPGWTPDGLDGSCPSCSTGHTCSTPFIMRPTDRSNEEQGGERWGLNYQNYTTTMIKTTLQHYVYSHNNYWCIISKKKKKSFKEKNSAKIKAAFMYWSCMHTEIYVYYNDNMRHILKDIDYRFIYFKLPVVFLCWAVLTYTFKWIDWKLLTSQDCWGEKT